MAGRTMSRSQKRRNRLRAEDKDRIMLRGERGQWYSKHSDERMKEKGDNPRPADRLQESGTRRDGDTVEHWIGYERT